jgi:hypothetical protein
VRSFSTSAGFIAGRSMLQGRGSRRTIRPALVPARASRRAAA